MILLSILLCMYQICSWLSHYIMCISCIIGFALVGNVDQIKLLKIKQVIAPIDETINLRR